jgi:histone H3/H4
MFVRAERTANMMGVGAKTVREWRAANEWLSAPKSSRTRHRLSHPFPGARLPVLLTPMSRTSTDSLPPAARAIALLLASTPTVQDAQPGVLHQLLEFSHRYTVQVLSDALGYAEHAGRSNKVELDDVTLAVQARVGWELGGRIPKEVGFLLVRCRQ